MKLIIEIPEEIYELITNDKSELKGLAKAVKNGIPLPKGHGKLIDADEIVYEEECIYGSDGCSTTISIANIDSTPTIIEADKEQTE